MKNLMCFLYGLSLFSFVILSYFFVTPQVAHFNFNVHTMYIQNKGIIVFVYMLLVVLITLFYLFFLYSFKKSFLGIKEIITITALTGIVLVFSYPGMLSYDIYNYMATSKVLFLYHENPYLVMPIEFTQEPLLRFMHAANKYALYGPVWIIFTWVPYSFSFNFISQLFFIKFFVSFFYFLASWIVWKLTKSIYSLFFFAINPLIIIETFVSGHNDIVMMSLALFAIYSMKRKKIVVSFIFLVLSILIKLATVFLVPLFVFLAWKTWKKSAIEWEKIYLFGFFAMLMVFFVSPIREEIYPWYAIWFLSFAALFNKHKLLQISTAIFSISLLFRYVPYLYTGTHAGYTPFIKMGVTFIPIFVYLLFLFFRKLIWKKSVHP